MTTVYEIVTRIKSGWYGYNLEYDDEYKTFSDGECEYQVRGYGNNEDYDEFRSILVRFCQDETHSYSEFFFYNYNEETCPEEVMLEEVFSETTLDRISKQIEERLKRKRGLVKTNG